MSNFPLACFLLWCLFLQSSYTLRSLSHSTMRTTSHAIPKPLPPTPHPMHISSFSKVGSFVGQGLGSKLLVGYWHNFDNGIGILPLSNVSSAWDVINLSFGVTGTDQATVSFTPVYGTVNSFITEIQGLQAKGQKVVLSIGGQNGIVLLPDATTTNAFVNSVIALVQQYGFDGIDLDLETGMTLNAGDTDFKNPTTPQLVNLISAVTSIQSCFGSNFIISLAPEIAYVQGGISAYAGVWGAYLPLIYGIRNILTFVQVQNYNAGGATGKDGNYYTQGTADFEVAMADALLSGFPIGYSTTNIFPALRPDQVVTGLPSCSQAAPSGGYIAPTQMIQALNYITKGVSFGGQYKLTNSSGYPAYRGLMTWSINWDVYNNFEFSTNYRAYFGASTSTPSTTSTASGSTSTTSGTTSGTSGTTSGTSGTTSGTTGTSGTTSGTAGTTSTSTTGTSSTTTSSSSPTNSGSSLVAASLTPSAVDSTGSFTLTATIPSGTSATAYTWYEGSTEITPSNCPAAGSTISIQISNKAAGTYTYYFTLTNSTSCISTVINVTVPAQASSSSGTSTSGTSASTSNTTTSSGTVINSGTGTTNSTSSTTNNSSGTTSTSSIPNWAVGVAYAAGNLVLYNGAEYQCLQAHTSIATWDPADVPSLWKTI